MSETTDVTQAGETLEIPEKSLVVLIGPSGAGKSTFAATHFAPTEVLSSDRCRGLVCDDEASMDATEDAFEVLHTIARKRLARGRFTVIDATNVQQRARRPLVALAREYHMLPVAVVLDIPTRVCKARNAERPDRDFGGGVIHRQRQQMKQHLGRLRREGFRLCYTLASPEAVRAAVVTRRPMWSDAREETGPFDIIGDVHGCCDELEELLDALGYVADKVHADPLHQYHRVWSHPEGRKAIFVGDLVDRGPRVLESIDLVRRMMAHGHALCVPGNHEQKMMRKLQGRKVTVAHGLGQTLDEIEEIPAEWREAYTRALAEFVRGLPGHLVLDDGALVVAHAGLKEELQGRASGKVRSFALYGETSGETDEFGLPVRHDWARAYKGNAMVVYGHTPVPHVEWLNRTMNVDTGCVFGGELTALRYPERAIEQVAAHAVYADPIRPIAANARGDELSAQMHADRVLDIEDVRGKLHVETRLLPTITIRETQSAAALEVISRFAVHPKWLIHLPPTMSPTHTSERDGYLEAPEEAFAYYRKRGVERVVCEEKHMGSRAVAIVCRDEEVVRERFGLTDAGIGVITTRTGRPFFGDKAHEVGLLQRLRAVLTETNFWEEYETGWVCIDAEVMPWSVKARGLLTGQYAPVGAAAITSSVEAVEHLAQAKARGVDVSAMDARFAARADMARGYREAYRQYCWSVDSLNDIEIAPFHILATEQRTYFDRSHEWHMQAIATSFRTGEVPSMRRTRYRVVRVGDEQQVCDAITWWEELTGEGGEGMVIKPYMYVTRDGRGRVVQPALKCRGREYLRIIYGPEYTTPAYLERLRKRGVGRKRSLAFREFALGIEALERFVQRAPLRQVHQCVFGVLALESEPVDPRL